MMDLTSYIHLYFRDWDRISALESYKWEALKHFKENYDRNYENLEEKIRTVFSKADNLLSSYNYLPLDVLIDFSKEEANPLVLQELLDGLLIEGEVPTVERVSDFIQGSKKLMKQLSDSGYRDWKNRKNLNTYQDVHAVSVYLSMFYPNEFYIYKYGIYKAVAKLFNRPITTKNHIHRLFEFQSFCDDVKSELIKDKELIKFYKAWLEDHRYTDDNLNLLTQDFIYSVACHLNEGTYKKVKGNKNRVRHCEEISASEILPLSPRKHPAFIGVKDVDYAKIDKNNRRIGVLGELWTINYEKERLQKLGFDPDKVIHASRDFGDGCGYDIQSLEDDGETIRYIEVKTTSGNINQPLFFTDNELAFSKTCKEHYYLYRVYNFKDADEQADLTILNLSLDELYPIPVVYKTVIEKIVNDEK